ncbi:MAG: hypothetical protein OXN89_16360 [Bryobacterales bacterium]|nr:hypothetical protein [Bryobacterales bacterium]
MGGTNLRKGKRSISAVRSIAARQVRDYQAGQPGSVFNDPGFRLSLDDAYLVQLEAVRLRLASGESVAGYKIGCVSATVRKQLGTQHAVFGHVFQDEVKTSPARVAASNYSGLGVEGELAVRLSQRLSDLDSLRGAPESFVAEVLPVIELHNYVFRGGHPRAAEVVANNALHAGIVVPAVRGPLCPNLDVGIRVQIGQRVDEQALVNPFATLHELASRLASFDITPQNGDILLTGSPLPLYRVSSGENVWVRSTDGQEVTALID